jgi:uncharacterized protein
VIARRHFLVSLAGLAGAVATPLVRPNFAFAQERNAKRIALVIGVQVYDRAGPLTELRTPVQDAEAVATKLTKIGVKTTLLRNPTTDELRTAIGEFNVSVSVADLAIVYYAGHAIQATIGGSKTAQFFAPRDFRAPTGADKDTPVKPEDFEKAASDGRILGLSMLEEPIRRARKVGLMFWDACRSNPFYDQPVALNGTDRVMASAENGRRTRTAGPLDKAVAPPIPVTTPSRLEIKRPEGIVIHFATRPGDVADDGTGTHSPYTAALLKHLDRPGITVNAMLNAVGTEVLQSTGGKQAPQLNNELYGGDVFLVSQPVSTGNGDGGRSNERVVQRAPGQAGTGRPSSGVPDCKEGPGCKTSQRRPDGSTITTTTSGFAD